MPGPHSSNFMAYMHLTQDHWVWFYSGIALGEEVCFGTPILWGASCVRTPSSPLLRKTCTLSVSVVVKSHCTFRSGDHGSSKYLVLKQGFAITELGILCWGTPPNQPTTPRILDSKMCCHDQKQACLWRLDVAISYLLLLRSTCHDPSFMPHYPFSFSEPTTIHLSHWPTQSYLNWFTSANVSMP
jgi:hypothetical protein